MTVSAMQKWKKVPLCYVFIKEADFIQKHTSFIELNYKEGPKLKAFTSEVFLIARNTLAKKH